MEKLAYLQIILLSFMLSNVEIESIWFPEHDLLNNISSFFLRGYCSSSCWWEPDKGCHRQTVHENVASLFPHFTWPVVFPHTHLPPVHVCISHTYKKERRILNVHHPRIIKNAGLTMTTMSTMAFNCPLLLGMTTKQQHITDRILSWKVQTLFSTTKELGDNDHLKG